MIIGVLKEVKDHENRVAMTPECTAAFKADGHRVMVERNAGTGSRIPDGRYQEAGAEIIDDKHSICEQADLILKVKEPVPEEYDLFKPGQMLFTFFHFASNRVLTRAMQKSGAICIAYETVQTPEGQLPLLSPMSQIAGKMATIVGAHYLARSLGGKGILASPVAGAKPARFTILGSGNAGKAAASVALGIGAEVLFIAESQPHIDEVRQIFPSASFELSSAAQIESAVRQTDVLIATVYVTGAKAPRLVTRSMVEQMQAGSVIIDISIDQGGCVETSRPTTHSDPVFIENEIVHYCVTNMPGGFPETATCALTDATLPYALKLAEHGINAFKHHDLLKGLNIFKGRITNRQVAAAFDMPYTPAEQCLPS